METLILIGLLGGLITGISPCILPMLPVIFFAGGVEAARERAAADAGSSGGSGLDGPPGTAGTEGGPSRSPDAGGLADPDAGTTSDPLPVPTGGVDPGLFAGAPSAVRVGRGGRIVTGAAQRPGGRVTVPISAGPSGTDRSVATSTDAAPGATPTGDPDGGTAADGTGAVPADGRARAARHAASRRPATARSWRPYLVIAGLVVSFSVFTLLGSLLLGALGLPQDLLRWLGIALLAAIGVGMVVPRFEEVLERPFLRLAALGSRRGPSQDRGAFLLGLGLGVLYVPCAGPVLAAITVAGATGDIGPGTVALTVSFAVGAAVPLLVFALAGRRVAERVRGFQRHQRGIRVTGGIVMIALAGALALDLPAQLQRALPDYTGTLQERLDSSGTVEEALGLGGIVTDANRELSNCESGATELADCGTAPPLTGITQWLNTPGGEPIDLADLRGKVVLIDFWTYSCINCQRALPHVNAWYDAYADAGLEVIGVHTPEFAFERETRNVVAGAADLGVDHPIAQDNAYSTWTGYRNRYWPAEYLIDAEGTVRYLKFGEGDYATTEGHVRELLRAADPDVVLPDPTDVVDSTPGGERTPETYLSLNRVFNYAGPTDYGSGERAYEPAPDQQDDTFSLAGRWEVDFQGATAAADDARLRLAYRATDVYAVLGGEGTVTARVLADDGSVRAEREVDVTGSPTLHDVLRGDGPTSGVVELDVPPGVTVYTFTFG
ncbi:cytochrome c biogenesis protein CcdA [Isoptericola jiangsuensis]|uniref:Cytochrome c biogenesis protein CcdA n=1 Tax=Isoptericola jiangsuensis TaxID=548579 RepID=A0A2A9F1R7_9MICO|nr:cytochrome c biogenesis protein DipZ [Isoptericola jiangsuensis]PFG44482.1 cytochrome c biogenesis protein CcdA [Isoptericola jiangsuensis]